MSDDLPEQLGHPDDERPPREDLREHLGKQPLDEPAVHDDPADHGIRHDQATAGSGDVISHPADDESAGRIGSPAPTGGSGDRGQDGTEQQTGPGPQTDWLRDAPGSGRERDA